jgi:hypothetical protein
MSVNPSVRVMLTSLRINDTLPPSIFAGQEQHFPLTLFENTKRARVLGLEAGRGGKPVRDEEATVVYMKDKIVITTKEEEKEVEEESRGFELDR